MHATFDRIRLWLPHKPNLHSPIGSKYANITPRMPIAKRLLHSMSVSWSSIPRIKRILHILSWASDSNISDINIFMQR